MVVGAVACVATTPRELWPWNRPAARGRPDAGEAGWVEAEPGDEALELDLGASVAEDTPRSPRHIRFTVELPDSWEEKREAGFPRLYRPNSERAGYFYIGLRPIDPSIVGNGGAALEFLKSVHEGEEGKTLKAAHEVAEVGVLATIVRRVPKVGIVVQWLAPVSEVGILATYQMGSPETVQQEVQAAARMIATIRWHEVEDSPLLGRDGSAG